MFVVSVFVFVFVSALDGETLPVVVFIDGQVSFRADAILSYKAGSVSGLALEHRVSLGKCFFGEMCAEAFDTVTTRPLACEDAGPAGSADRGGDKGVCKPYAVCRQVVHIRRLDDWISGTAHSIGPMVVGQ